MSDDGLLSQEDIDALTAGLFGENGDVVAEATSGSGNASKSIGGNGGGGSDDESSDEPSIDPEEIRPLFKIVTNQASGVITTAINKNVEYKIETIGHCNAQTAGGAFAKKHLVVKVKIEGDISGQLFLLYSQKDTAVMSDLMMMGDGSANFEEDHKEALAELINQVMGSVNTSISTDFDMQISIGQAETTDYAIDESPFGYEGSVICVVSFAVEGIRESTMAIIANKALTESFYARVKGNSDPFHLALPDDQGSLAAVGALPEIDSPEMAAPTASGAATLFESTGNRALDMLLDIPLDITIELGRCNMSIRKILELGPGSVLELDRFAGEPVDLLINDKVVARGEVVVVDENFGIRVVSLVTPEERLKFLK